MQPAAANEDSCDRAHKIIQDIAPLAVPDKIRINIINLSSPSCDQSNFDKNTLFRLNWGLRESNRVYLIPLTPFHPPKPKINEKMGDLPKLVQSRDVIGKVDNIHSNLTQSLREGGSGGTSCPGLGGPGRIEAVAFSFGGRIFFFLPNLRFWPWEKIWGETWTKFE